ncbi:hypothetical protein BRYFOR_06779 [Marvinbryantia formatexigens DSM 14469]|uniref:Uncharacterized protein n=1 Tax=Marvinbryantia formatexigens DSM 14469 TaxID=478749 RepID=C6LDT0_9FIRM|nr:hypothetical protein BRYFOR_06779 [Marvinbryantia formatexigens DSM 14469]
MIDYVRLLRYARRRGKADEVKKYITCSRVLDCSSEQLSAAGEKLYKKTYNIHCIKCRK